MKKYITILGGIVVLLVVIFGGYKFINNRDTNLPAENENQPKMVSFTGSVVREFNGENRIDYSFDIPETATTSIEMNGALIKVTDASSTYATIYMSYEGARGFGPIEYLDAVIAPHVSVVNPVGVSTIGNYEWEVAESEGSEWHITKINDGKWLMIVQNKKTVNEPVARTLASTKVN